MTNYLSLVARLPDEIRIPLADVLSAFKQELSQMVTKEDFGELKKIVGELSGEVRELAQAQKRTEEEVQKLALGLGNLRKDVGGLSQSFSYAFENEAYKALPAYFEKKLGIKITERFVREEVEGSEINFLARGKKGKKVITLVGEAKLRLEESQTGNGVFAALQKKVKAVQKAYAPKAIQPFLVTHYASKTFLRKAKKKGIPVVQSFEF